MLAAGVSVERVGIVPTPALYYAVAARGLDGGMQITGSHNPPEFNGFKMTKGKLPLFGAEIQEMKRMIEAGDLERGPAARWSDRPILDEYRAMLIERCRVAEGPARRDGLRQRLRGHGRAAGVRAHGAHGASRCSPSSTAAFRTTCPTRPFRRCSWTCRRRWRRPAPTSASVSMATPTASAP